MEKVHTITITTGLVENGRTKCASDWTFDVNRDVDIHDYVYVEFIKGEKKEGYNVSGLEMWMKNEETQPETKRIVKHFWFDSWYDNGVPENSSQLINMRYDIRIWHKDDHGTLIAHCITGIGRTGTLIGINIGMESLYETKKSRCC